MEFILNYNLVLINQLKNETLIRAGFNVSYIVNSDILALLFKDYLTSNKKSLEISHHIITDKKFVYIPESFLLNTFFNYYNFYSGEENHLKFIEFLSVYIDLFLDNNSEFDNLFSDSNQIIGNLFSNGNWEIIKLFFDKFFEMEDNLYYKMLIDKIVFEIKSNYTFSNYTDSNQ